MTPAPDTGRTAEENELREAIAYTMAMRTALRPSLVEDLAEWQRVGYSSPEQDARANAWKWYGAADALLSGPLAPILQEAAHLRAENANLRDRVREAEGAVEAMRERCARWHEDRAEEFAREARDRTLPDGSWAGRDAMWARADAQAHREHATAIRALSPEPQEAGDGR